MKINLNNFSKCYYCGVAIEVDYNFCVPCQIIEDTKHQIFDYEGQWHEEDVETMKKYLK
jgi:hypothetical protein